MEKFKGRVVDSLWDTVLSSLWLALGGFLITSTAAVFGVVQSWPIAVLVVLLMVVAVFGIFSILSFIWKRKDRIATRERERKEAARKEELERRRILIARWREMLVRISIYYRGFGGPIVMSEDDLIVFIEQDTDYLALIPYLKPWSRGNVDRMVVVDSSRHGRILWLQENVDRLEREWRLLEGQ